MAPLARGEGEKVGWVRVEEGVVSIPCDSSFRVAMRGEQVRLT